jgi:hypothetical protein
LDIRGCWGSEAGHFLRALRALERYGAEVPWARIGAKTFGLGELNDALEMAGALKIQRRSSIPGVFDVVPIPDLPINGSGLPRPADWGPIQTVPRLSGARHLLWHLIWTTNGTTKPNLTYACFVIFLVCLLARLHTLKLRQNWLMSQRASSSLSSI